MAAGADTTMPTVDSVAKLPPIHPTELYAFIGRCRQSGVPVAACESMAMSESVVRMEWGRDVPDPSGAENRRLVRLACVVEDVDEDICWRWMPR